MVLVRWKMNWISIQENNHNCFWNSLIDRDSWGNLSNVSLWERKQKKHLGATTWKLTSHTFNPHVVNFTTMVAFGSIIKLPPNIWNMAPCLCHVLHGCFKVGSSFFFLNPSFEVPFELLKHGAHLFHKFVKLNF